LIEVIQEIQQVIVDGPEPIGEETVPIGNLCEFDSLVSVEATVNAFNSLGLGEPSCTSIFISKDSKALSLGQVADRILKLASKSK
jgi:hypothetical protein